MPRCETPSGTKRRRTLSPRQDDQQETDRSSRSEYWFDDGSVVIQAEYTQFRVHRTLLARHSSVFRDMFSVPQPIANSELLVEGCSVVHLSDSKQDIEYVISALYDQ
jgi:hypothetical protein